jgi:hypothetical protein
MINAPQEAKRSASDRNSPLKYTGEFFGEISPSVIKEKREDVNAERQSCCAQPLVRLKPIRLSLG